MNDPNKSINAIRDAMEKLDLDLAEKSSYIVRAEISNNLLDHLYGHINVKFNSNWHSGDGPFVEFGDEIKGFGIQHTHFQPRYQEFNWNASILTLSIQGH
jgi:hypothetical protein